MNDIKCFRRQKQTRGGKFASSFMLPWLEKNSKNEKGTKDHYGQDREGELWRNSLERPV